MEYRNFQDKQIYKSVFYMSFSDKSQFSVYKSYFAYGRYWFRNSAVTLDVLKIFGIYHSPPTHIPEYFFNKSAD